MEEKPPLSEEWASIPLILETVSLSLTVSSLLSYNLTFPHCAALISLLSRLPLQFVNL